MEKSLLSFRKRLILITVFIAACIFTGLFSSQNAYAKTYKIKTASDWAAIGKKKGGTFKLTKNIKLSKTSQYLTISKNKKYVIDLNGHKVYTTYAGVEIRSVCPLVVSKGTVTLKDSSKKKKGVLYSTETAAVTLLGKAKFYHKSGMIVNDAVEFRSNMPSGIIMDGSSKCYLQGSAKVQSIGNGITMVGSASLSLTGHPMIRAGANNFKGQFMHYGSGINIATPTCKLSIKGGNIGTKASTDTSLTTITGTQNYIMSGDYPIYDKNGNTLKTAKGYQYVDAKGNVVSITNELDNIVPGGSAFMQALTGSGGGKRLTTTTLSSDGYYTIYVVKK